MRDLLRLLSLYRPYKGWVLLGIFLSYITLIANVGLMALSGWFISAMAIAGVAGVSMNYFTPGAVIRFFAITRTVGRYLERLVTHEATFRLLSEMRHWFYEQLEPLAPGRLQQYHSGDLLSRIRADIDSLQNFYLRILTPVIVAILSTLSFVIFLSWYSLTLALTELALLLIAGIVIPYLSYRWGKTASARRVNTASDMRSCIIDGVQGMGELTVYGAAEKQAEKINRYSEQLIQDQRRLARLSGFTQAATGLCANTAMWLMVIIAIPYIRTAELPPPHLAMLALFTIASFEAITPLPLAFQTLGETLSAVRRIFAIADSKPLVEEPLHPTNLPATADLQLENLYFRYPGKNLDALNDISISIPYGKKLAITGATGSGKTTLINLLLRFYDPDSGCIKLGNEPLPHFESETLRQAFSVVSQHNHLFNTTIWQNLLLANPQASSEDIHTACKIAHAHEFVLAQPDGYKTFTGEAGVKLSGGQVQRLAVARALLKSADIFILDEPGDGLDPPTEKAMLHAVLDHLQEKSVVLITHRLTGLERMDEIIVMENGKIAAKGSFETLRSLGYLAGGFKD